MTEGGHNNPSRQPLFYPPCESKHSTHTHTTTTSSSAAGRRREGGGRPQTQSGSRTARIINPTMRKRVVGRAAWWMLLLRMLAWGAEGSSGRLQDWVGQDAESPPLIRQTLPARRRRPSPKSPGDVLPLSFGTRRASPRPAFQPGFHPCGCGRRPASASIGRWVVCVFTQPKDSMGRMDHGSYHDDGRVRVPLTWAPFPSVAKHVSWTASNPTKTPSFHLCRPSTTLRVAPTPAARFPLQ